MLGKTTPSRQRVRQYRSVGLLFGAIGLLQVGVGVGVGARTQRFVERAASAEGTVTELVRSRSSSSSSPTYRSVVRFTAANGEPIEFESTFGSNPPSHRTGDRVTVLYDPDLPQRARIRSFGSLWFLPLIFGGLGGVLTIVGGSLLVLWLCSR